MVLMEDQRQHLQKGISGWLSPKGEFIPVDYGNHAKAALGLEMNGVVKPIVDTDTGRLVHGERLLELLGYIKLVCHFTNGNPIESYVFFPQHFGCTKYVTKPQEEWLERNLESMAPTQKSYVMQYFY